MTHRPTSDPTSELDDLLRRHQPHADLRTEWDEPSQQAVLSAVMTGDALPTAPRPRGRWVRVGLVACAAATVPLALSIGLPSGSPGGPGAADALDRLALVAGASGEVVGPGHFLHRTATTDVPYVADVPMTPGAVRHGDRAVSEEESWSGQDAVWILSSSSGPSPCLEVVPLEGQVAEGSYDVAGADQLATLPTGPTGLTTFVDEHPDGGNRGTANRWAAATDLLWSGIASPQLHSAALTLLARTPGVTGAEHTTDGQGRSAIRVDHTTDGATESVWFDPTTAQIVERAGPTEGGTGSTTLTSSDVVGALPALPRCTPGG